MDTRLEHLMLSNIKRGMRQLAPHAKGNLERVARDLVEADYLNVVVLTGFFVQSATPPRPETDGPIGAIQLVSAIQALGGSARILTDSNCYRAIESVATAMHVRVDVDAPPAQAAEGTFRKWEQQILRHYSRPNHHVTHMISIERSGPAQDGRVYNMRGDDITTHCAPLDRIYSSGKWRRIAIGDGGNEIGMGNLPATDVAQYVEHGHRIRCVTTCDDLLISGVSNWGAAALVSAIALTAQGRARAADITRSIRPDSSRRALDILTKSALAVDGVTGKLGRSVDGIAWPRYCRQLELIHSASVTEHLCVSIDESCSVDGISVRFAAGAGNDRCREAQNAAGQRHRPVIALIDSGLGLLDTAHRIHQLRPDAELRLWIDSADAPWGTKDPAWIRARVLRTVEFALRDGAEIIVLPCNTASAHALAEARAASGPIPVVGTVPAIKPASARHAKFAIWATPATVRSAVQQDLIDTFASQAHTVPVASETLASAVEIGSRSQIRIAIDAAVALTPDDCTAVVLGCTHYSLVSKQIRKALRPDIELYDGAQAVADRTASLLPVQQIGSALGSVTVFDGGIQVRSLPRSALLYEPGLAIEKLCTSAQFGESGGPSGNRLWVDAAAEVVS